MIPILTPITAMFALLLMGFTVKAKQFHLLPIQAGCFLILMLIMFVR